MKKIIGEVILEGMLEIMVDKIAEENIEIAIEMTVMIEAGTGLEKGHFPEIMAIIELEVQATVDPGQDPELAQIAIEFNVIHVEDINHFTRDCPNSREEKEIEQLQQMLNLGDEQTIASPMSDIQAEFSRVSSEENMRPNHLNL